MRRFQALSTTLLLLSVCAGGCATSGTTPQAREQALASLHSSMIWVRGGGASEPRVLDELPPVDGLVGARRAQLQSTIGAPRTCRTAFEPPCRRVGEVLWTFYRGHAADEADGPVLVVDFDGAGVVVAARWRRPEVHAPAPIAPSAGGEAEISAAD